MGGGTELGDQSHMQDTGLSPRGRGNQIRITVVFTRTGSIPAWAGEPQHLVGPNHALRVYPRVGGGTCVTVNDAPPNLGLSPRGRGNPKDSLCWICGGRSIPAWAGEPPMRRPAISSHAVYPRVGGGTTGVHAPSLDQSGLSPRGRGNRIRVRRFEHRRRSIPAWAGEP